MSQENVKCKHCGQIYNVNYELDFCSKCGKDIFIPKRNGAHRRKYVDITG